MSTYQVVHIPPELVPQAFYSIKDYVLALEKRSSGRVIARQVYIELASGRHDLYIVYDEELNAVAFYTIRPETHGSKRGLIIYWLGGKGFRNWIDVVREKLTERAEHDHVDFVRFETPRKGWDGIVTKMGMQPVGTIYEIRFGKQEEPQEDSPESA